METAPERYYDRAHFKVVVETTMVIASLLLVTMAGTYYVMSWVDGWSATLAFVVGLLLCALLALVWTREFWKWRYWYREFDPVRDLGMIHRPGNRWLFIKNFQPATVKLSSVTISESSGQSRVEQYIPFFHRSSTLTLDSEALLDTAFHNMRNFRDATHVIDVVTWCLGQEQRRNQQQAETLERLLIEAQRTNDNIITVIGLLRQIVRPSIATVRSPDAHEAEFTPPSNVSEQ